MALGGLSEDDFSSAARDGDNKIAFTRDIDVYGHATFLVKTHKFWQEHRCALNANYRARLSRVSLGFSGLNDPLVLSYHFLRRVGLAFGIGGLALRSGSLNLHSFRRSLRIVRLNPSSRNEFLVLFRQVACSIRRLLGSVGRIQDGLFFAIRNGSGFRGSISLIATGLYQPFILSNHALHSAQLVSGCEVLKPADYYQSSSNQSEQNTTTSQHSIRYGRLEPAFAELLISHVLAAILALVGAIASAFGFVLTLAFAEGRAIFIRAGVCLVLTFAFMTVFILTL